MELLRLQIVKRTILIRIVAGAVIAVFVAESWLQNGRPNLSWIKAFSLAVSVATLALAAWDFWLWRLPLLQRLPGTPRSVRGTWKGTLTSYWKDPTTGQSPSPKSVYLVIRQTGTLISVRLMTNESSSASSLATVAEADGSCILTYMYLNTPELQFEHHSRMHHGSTVLDISGRPAKRLRGRYWTDRDSKGELDFIFRTNRLADDFAEAESFFGAQSV